MSISPLSNLSNTYLQPVLGTALRSTGLNNNSNGALSGINVSSLTQPDGGQLSPLAQLLSTLQQLQQSNPAQYQQVTQQIATNLQHAAQANGNTTAANQLNQLATDFTNASKSGQLPNISDLAQAVGGHHHHHAHAASSDNDGDGDSGGTGSNGLSTSSALRQLVSSLQVNSTQNDALNPIAIIENTLANAGLSGSNGQ